MPPHVAKRGLRQSVRYTWRRFDTAVDDSKTIPEPFATAAGSARIPEPLDSWRRFEDDPIGFPAPNKPLSRARRKFGHIRGWPPLLSLGYPNAHVARDLPDQAEGSEGQGSRCGQEQSKRRGATRAKCSAIAPRRGLRLTRGSSPFGASRRRCWTSAVKRGSSGRRTEPLETLHGVVENCSEIEELLWSGEMKARRRVLNRAQTPSRLIPPCGRGH
jgi:hypothetical protein